MKNLFLFLAILMSINSAVGISVTNLISYWILLALEMDLPSALLLEEKLRSRKRMGVSQGHVKAQGGRRLLKAG